MNNSARKIPYVILIATLCATTLVLADHDDDDDDAAEHESGSASKRALPVVSQPQWSKECSACHMLYPPALFPERSWRAMMGGLKNHFGDNAQLDAVTQQTITTFLAQNAADRTPARRAEMVARSIPAREAPLRITQTRYFLRKHDEIRPAVFARAKVGSAANCVACHAGAENGVFSEHEVKIPR